MKKKELQRIGDNIHLIFNNAAQWLKTSLEENARDFSVNSVGATGIILKLISKPLIDHYFAKQTAKKLDNWGNQTYLKAAYEQGADSMGKIEPGIKSHYTAEEIIEILKDITVSSFENIRVDSLFLVFQPKYHPVVLKVKDSYVEMLKALQVDDQTISSFRKDFNEHIEERIKKTFSEDYSAHVEQIKEFVTEEKETKFLWETFRLARIGFEENENLKYETAYGSWEELYKNKQDNYIINPNQLTEIESGLKTVKELIEEYFAVDSNNHLEKILFVIADFGKGKSVFMKNYAAELAREYVTEKEGYFPVYFNLREYSAYDPNGRLGILEDYLITKYGIKIDSEPFKNRKYIFLVDSLDESGELKKETIESVINSVKKIQHLDKETIRTNRIVISSRPLSDGFHEIISSHKPHCIRTGGKKEIAKEHYISLYGFKKEQFNNWLYSTLKLKNSNKASTSVSFVSKIYESIQTNDPVDIYDELLKNETLQSDELRRPIFAYMIYQLIVNNIDFLQLGKTGIYLSFINLLTKDAKHIKDPNYKVDLKQEFEFRNILHATAALWMYERHTGKQGFLKKADLCRVLEGESKYRPLERDEEILKRYKNEEITEIQFLSHSYFGEDNNTLHFQHQSFAEMLLAEYYLKVFIKFALEDDLNVEEARARLILGEPTEQTITFLEGLLQLLKETISTNNSEEVIEKRKLLLPLLSSLATKKNNLLFSTTIYYEWYRKYAQFTKGDSEYPSGLLTNWYIDENIIGKILDLAKKIIESPHTFLLAKPEPKSALYSKELNLIYNQNINEIGNDIDKWIALLVG
ncbi:MAG: hypothetical protein LUH10_11030, partial [Tannerellaceae bacterium]|nr:hypothetical protein [Tannerellaceae bacterium]